ncbi:hypothetical protein MHU86_6709 [Fragilaria crotonensis]|nr:hypothetical protein MHU86_6709 [Fragilaria crotonensis]
MKKESDCSLTEKEIKQKLESIRENDCKGPNFIPKNDDHTFSPFHRVYKCGKNSNEQFRNATESTIDSLFQKPSKLDSVVNYTRDEVEIALKNAKNTVPVSMSQEIHLPEEPLIDAGHETEHTNTHLDDNDDILMESTSLETDCIDFGSRALHHEDVSELERYNAYDSIMPRAKELVSLVDASKAHKREVFLLRRHSTRLSSPRKPTWLLKPPPKGSLVSGCPVGKVCKTYVSSWSF